MGNNEIYGAGKWDSGVTTLSVQVLAELGRGPQAVGH